MTRILITGKDSFIGTSVERYLSQWPDQYQTDTIDMVDGAWRSMSFSNYDVIFHVAGIAHSDAGHITAAQKAAYYKINTDLTIETAQKAKKDGVRQFIFMSSAIVYGNSGPIGQKKRLNRHTPVTPANSYGDSKVKAEEGILALSEQAFRVVVLRPPMIYGPGCKGNYPILSKLARILPVFPRVENERSMLYVENLAEFVRLMIQNEEQGIFFPQNAAYVNTSDLVKIIAAAHGKKLIMLKGFTWLLKLMGRFTGLVDKAFGNLSYEPDLSDYRENYQVCDLHESIQRTENCVPQKRALILASVASMIDQFNMPNIRLLLEAGFQVDVVANFEHGNTTSSKRTDELRKHLTEMGVQVIHMPIPRRISDIKDIFDSYRQVKRLCLTQRYALLHCHSPIGSVVARLAAHTARKKYGTQVIYTAHGFHFYKGAPMLNWCLFYPIEKICAHYTDVLITINREDYAFARQKLNAGRIEYVQGIGIDLNRYTPARFVDKRKEFGFSESDIVLLSVGELNENKNHITAIRALGKLANVNLHYLIAGHGVLAEQLKREAETLHVNLHLLGYRTDIHELLGMADIFLFPSYREGLSVSLMEAMASGLPCIPSDIRGNVDLIDEGKGGYLCPPADADAFAEGIRKVLASNHRADMGFWNREKIQDFSLDNINERMKQIYLE